MRRAIISLLLLFLVSVQAFAGMCSVRCATMSSADTQNPMPGMANCGMSHHAATDATSAALMAHSCSAAICQNDLSLLPIRADQGMGVPQSSAVTPIVAGIPAASLFPARDLSRYRLDRSKGLGSPFDPLLSSLRI